MCALFPGTYAQFSRKRLSPVEFSPLAANAFTQVCCYNARPRATGQRAERGFNGPKTLSEGKPPSQEWASHKRALDWQVARRRDSVGWKHHPALQMGGLGNDPGLPNAETRTARFGSSSVNN